MTWIEMKAFTRESLGAFGTIDAPVLIFVVVGRAATLRCGAPSFAASGLSGANLPVLVSLLISVSAVLSLITIISIYREGGILKRLRATPLPQDHSQCPCDRQAPAHCSNISSLDAPCGQTLLPTRRSRSMVLVYDRTAHQHLEYPVDRLSYRQHRSHGTLCAADRRRLALPHPSCASPK